MTLLAFHQLLPLFHVESRLKSLMWKENTVTVWPVIYLRCWWHVFHYDPLTPVRRIGSLLRMWFFLVSDSNWLLAVFVLNLFSHYHIFYIFKYLCASREVYVVWKSGRDHCPGMQNGNFQFQSVPLKCQVLKLSIVTVKNPKGLSLENGLTQNKSYFIALVVSWHLHMDLESLKK